MRNAKQFGTCAWVRGNYWLKWMQGGWAFGSQTLGAATTLAPCSDTFMSLLHYAYLWIDSAWKYEVRMLQYRENICLLSIRAYTITLTATICDCWTCVGFCALRSVCAMLVRDTFKFLTKQLQWNWLHSKVCIKNVYTKMGHWLPGRTWVLVCY